MKLDNNEANFKDISLSLYEVLEIAVHTIEQIDEAHSLALLGTMLRAYCDTHNQSIANVCVELCKADVFIREVENND